MSSSVSCVPFDEGGGLSPRGPGRRAASGLALAVLAAAWLQGCGGGAALRAPSAPVAWPSPEDAQVRFVGGLVDPSALGYHRGFWGRALDVVFGGERILLDRPQGVAVSEEGLLAVADSGSATVHLFDLRRKTYDALGGETDARLRCPVGVAFGGGGRILVTDSARGHVLIYGRDGACLGELPGEFARPTGIAVDAKRGRTYVVDTGRHCVEVYETGEAGASKLATWGQRGDGSGEFNFPTSAWVDEAGDLFVSDSLNFRVQVLDPSGKVKMIVGTAGSGSGRLGAPKGVAADAAGRVFVADGHSGLVHVFDGQGRFLLAFGGLGPGEGGLGLPAGVCLDREGRLYVADGAHGRVQVYDVVASLARGR